MNCPKCGGMTYIVDTRSVPDGVRRRRMCGSKLCGHRFTTCELEYEKAKNELATLRKIRALLNPKKGP
jgi:transcriptional regulator NrdR family protein